MADMALALQVCGIIGVCTTNSLTLSLLRPVLEARREGSLAGLDARLWPLNFMNQMLWVGYSIALGDLYVFLAALPAAVLWLFFCLTVVELLSQEEGELTPQSPRVHLQKQDYQRSNTKSFDDLYTPASFDSLHGLSKTHRTALIQKTELFVCGGLLFSGIVSFALIPDKFMGLPLLPEETRLQIYGMVCTAISLACNIEPVKKVGGVARIRDASTVHVPMVMAALTNNCVWFTYGILTMNVALILPITIGILNFCALLLLRFVFGSGSKVEGEGEEAKTGAQGGDVAGVQEAWGTICPSPVTMGKVPPRLNIHKRLHSASSSASVVSSASAARSTTKLVAGSARSSTTGHDNDIANLEDLESPFGSALASETTFTPSTSGTPEGLPNQGGSDLPDLSGRLKEMGVYEDYLKWQRDYQKWRKGGARGAKGECQVGTGGAASSSAAIRIDEVEEVEETD